MGVTPADSGTAPSNWTSTPTEPGRSRQLNLGSSVKCQDQARSRATYRWQSHLEQRRPSGHRQLLRCVLRGTGFDGTAGRLLFGPERVSDYRAWHGRESARWPTDAPHGQRSSRLTFALARVRFKQARRAPVATKNRATRGEAVHATRAGSAGPLPRREKCAVSPRSR